MIGAWIGNSPVGRDDDSVAYAAIDEKIPTTNKLSRIRQLLVSKIVLVGIACPNQPRIFLM